jgi:DNA ligase-1
METDTILPFQVLTTRARKNVAINDIKVQVCLYVFDVLLVNGQSLLQTSLQDRKSFLQAHLIPVRGKLSLAETRAFCTDDPDFDEQMKSYLTESVDNHCEGLMIKALVGEASFYQPQKRSQNWLKFKKDYMDGPGDSVDLVPIGAWFGKGRRTGVFGAFLLAVYDAQEEEFQSTCKIGTGFSDEDLNNFAKFFADHHAPDKPSSYMVDSKMSPDVWFDPVTVWEVKFADLSISPVHTGAFGLKQPNRGIGLRFPRFVRLRPDKLVFDCTSNEQLVDMYESQKIFAHGGEDSD